MGLAALPLVLILFSNRSQHARTETNFWNRRTELPQLTGAILPENLRSTIGVIDSQAAHNCVPILMMLSAFFQLNPLPSRYYCEFTLTAQEANHRGSQALLLLVIEQQPRFAYELGRDIHRQRLEIAGVLLSVTTQSLAKNPSYSSTSLDRLAAGLEFFMCLDSDFTSLGHNNIYLLPRGMSIEFENYTCYAPLRTTLSSDDGRGKPLLKRSNMPIRGFQGGNLTSTLAGGGRMSSGLERSWGHEVLLRTAHQQMCCRKLWEPLSSSTHENNKMIPALICFVLEFWKNATIKERNEELEQASTICYNLFWGEFG
ncbi:hypothetical protein BJ742DRAFT_873709 [Cladochytrium replicatum]|nr:hypothetical protein BJ742DRAFT_873709 [Cladochytrium replicatum]